MGFDKNNPDQPLVRPERRTTQVNVWIAIGVLVMILASFVYLVHAHKHPVETQNSAVQELDHKP